MELYENLARLRKEKGLSQQELAERLNVSRQSISKWELGTALPSTENLIGLSRLYGASLDYLVGNSDTREREDADSAEPAEAAPAAEAPPDGPKSCGRGRRAVLERILLAVLSLAVVVLAVALVYTIKKAEAPEKVLQLEEMERGMIDPADFEEDFSIDYIKEGGEIDENE